MSERVPNWPETGCTRALKVGMELRCSTCGAERTWSKVLPPARVRTVADRDAWTIGKKWKSAACPGCAAKIEQQQTMSPANDTQRIGFKRVFALLLEHYDEPGQCYEGDWTDDRIAAETAMAPSFVAKVRDEHFGPAEDPRIGDLRAELAEARREAKVEIADLRQLVADAEAKWSARFDDLGQRIAKIAGPK